VLRCLEQIRNDVCYHHANVKIVCVGGGLAYGNLGFSHHATEDLAIMRALPGMVVVAPADPAEAECATKALASHEGPAYLRLGRAGEPMVNQQRPDFQLGRAAIMRSGSDITLVSTGAMLMTACGLADRLSARGLSVRLLSMHTLQPLDRDAVAAAAAETRLVVTLEEHSIVGGLGGAVAEVVAELPQATAVLKRFGMASGFSSEVGDQEHLRRLHCLDLDGLERALDPVLAECFSRVG
jgi:transketolase